MAIPCDVENGGRRGEGDEIKEPLIKCQQKGFISAVCEEDMIHGSSGGDKGSIWMVLLSTFVAVCGSYEFGCCSWLTRLIPNFIHRFLDHVLIDVIDEIHVVRKSGDLGLPVNWILVGYSAPTQSDIRKNLDLSLAEYSVFGSIVTIGAMIGAITSGGIADWIGRKRAMAMSAAVCIVGWLALCLSKDAFFLDFGRFCTGYGIGVFSYVVPVFIAEITPKNLRGGLATIHQVLITSGISVTFIIGTVMPWRLLAITGIIPCVILLCGIGFIPESPRWLAKVGRHKQFEEALQRLRGNDPDIYQEAAEIQDYIDNLKTLPKARVQDLFQGRYTRSLIVGVGLMLFQQFSGINGVLFYASETFVSAGFSSGKIGTMATGCIQVPVTILGALLMDKSGRRALLMASASGSCLGCLFTGLSLYLKALGVCQGWVPIVALVGILLYLGSFSLGMAAVPWVMMSEIFPINMKGIAGSFVTMISWFGSWALSFTFNFLMRWSPPGTFFLFAGFCALTVVFVALIVPETKGRTLEEIQADLNS